MKIRWGILGTARIADRMALAIQSSNNGEVVAIASRKNENAIKFARKYGIANSIEGYQSLLESSIIDAVYIPLPNDLHKKWTLEAARNKKHVLCEKPFALNHNEASSMFKNCQEAGVKVMEGFMYRFNPIVTAIKSLIEQKVIGEVKFVNFSFSHGIKNYLGNSDNYRYYKDQGGGALYDLGIYCISFFNYLFGFQSHKVMNSFSYQKTEQTTDVTYMGTIQYKNSILYNFTSSFEFYGNYIIISGTNGIIEVNHMTSPSERTITVKNLKNEITNTIVCPEYDHFKAQIEHFNNSIIENKNPMITSEETLATLSILDQLKDKEIIILIP